MEKPDVTGTLKPELYVSHMDGSKYTYDWKARCGYLSVAPGEWTAARTVDLGNGIQVDLDEDGRLLGIERISGAVNDWTMVYVLRRVQLIDGEA